MATVKKKCYVIMAGVGLGQPTMFKKTKVELHLVKSPEETSVTISTPNNTDAQFKIPLNLLKTILEEEKML